MDHIPFTALSLYSVEYLENNTILNEAISEIALPTVQTFQVPSSGGMYDHAEWKHQNLCFWVACYCVSRKKKIVRHKVL